MSGRIHKPHQGERSGELFGPHPLLSTSALSPAPAGSTALAAVAHVCPVQNRSQCAPECSEGFTSTVMFKGGNGGVFYLVPPLLPTSHSLRLREGFSL